MPPLADPRRSTPPSGRARKRTHAAAAAAVAATFPPASQERRTSWDIMGYHGIIWASMESAGTVAPPQPPIRGCQQLLTVVKLKDSLPTDLASELTLRAGRSGCRRCGAAADT